MIYNEFKIRVQEYLGYGRFIEIQSMDKSSALKGVAENGLMLRHISLDLSKDKMSVLEAVQNNTQAQKCAGISLKCDEGFLEFVAKQSTERKVIGQKKMCFHQRRVI